MGFALSSVGRNRDRLRYTRRGVESNKEILKMFWWKKSREDKEVALAGYQARRDMLIRLADAGGSLSIARVDQLLELEELIGRLKKELERGSNNNDL